MFYFCTMKTHQIFSVGPTPVILDRENKFVIAMSSFSRSYAFKVFSVHTDNKTQSHRFPIPPVPFWWRISVAARPYSVIYFLPKHHSVSFERKEQVLILQSKNSTVTYEKSQTCYTSKTQREHITLLSVDEELSCTLRRLCYDTLRTYFYVAL